MSRSQLDIRETVQPSATLTSLPLRRMLPAQMLEITEARVAILAMM